MDATVVVVVSTVSPYSSVQVEVAQHCLKTDQVANKFQNEQLFLLITWAAIMDCKLWVVQVLPGY